MPADDTGPRPRAADDFDTIGVRLAELKREREQPSCSVPYCGMCGAADATETAARCTGMCEGG